MYLFSITYSTYDTRDTIDQWHTQRIGKLYTKQKIDPFQALLNITTLLTTSVLSVPMPHPIFMV